MAHATNETECVARHVDYVFDVGKTEMSDLQRRRLEAIGRHVQAGEAVLDVGCNSGYIVDFVPSSCHCFGVDVAPALVKVARTRLVGAHVARAEQLPYVDGSMDVVILGEILEHVYDPAVVLREACRVARRAVIGSTPHEAGWWGTASVEAHAFHVRCYDRSSLTEALRPFGDVAIEVVQSDKGRPQMYVFSVAVTPGEVSE